MKTEKININGIPSIIWGESSSKVLVAIHGNMSNKEDEVIKILARKVVRKGYQLLSFDLPEHGERVNNKNYLCKVQNCVSDLNLIMKYAKTNFDEINLWACSMGAYFSLLAYKYENIKKCLFLSPIINMKIIIDNIMLCSNVNENELKEKQEVKTEFGQTLYWDYYKYVKDNPITNWNKETYILYGNKDNMQNEDIIKDFCNKFNGKLTILENGEHKNQKKDQISFYKNWLDKIIK